MMLPFPDPRYEFWVSGQSEFLDFGFEPTLFNSPAYIALQNAENHYSFYLIPKSTAKVVAVSYFKVNGEQAISPYRAPFGSVETAPEVTLLLAEDFVRAITGFLKDKGIQQVTVKHYPFCYGADQSALITNAFLFLDFQVELSQINHHLPVTAASFESQIHESGRRRLRKCRENGFTFQPEPATFLPEAYAFIKACRLEKNKPLSLSEEQLQQLFDHFPDRYFIFSVRDQGEIAAVTVAIKIRSDVLLTFYPASPYSYNAFSPAIMLNEGLYAFCQQNHLAILDYGISGVKEDPHYSLMKFKEHLGGLPTLKLTFSGNLR